MTQTTNYHLLKPGYDDPVDVKDLNDNMDLIDVALTSKANLVGGKVPASELPSYVDDVIEGYYYNGAFYRDSAHTTAISGETGKIYIDLDSETCYRWTGSVYAQVSAVDLVITGYYYNGDFYSDSLHTELINGEEGKLYVDINTENCYRWDSVYIQISSPESEIYWATYDTTLDAAGIAAAYAELQAAVSAGQMILLFISPYTYYCSDFIGGVQPAFYFCNYDQFPTLRKYTFSALTGWSAMSQTTIATKTYVDTAIHDAGQLPQGTNQDDILVWDANATEWVAAPYPSGSLPTGTADDDFLVWDDTNSVWQTRAKGTITSGSTGYATGGDVYTAIGNIPQIPTGTNTGDILEWSGSVWVAKPKWQMLYQPVEYIESTGTQCIDSEVVADADFSVELDMAFTSTSVGGLVGARDAHDGNWRSVACGIMNSLNFGINAAYPENWTELSSANTQRHVWLLSPTVQKMDGTVVANGDYSTISNTVLTFGLFARHTHYQNMSPDYDSYAQLRLYGCKMWDNEQLVRNFIPCYIIYTGEIGMFDTVENKFYTNAGTGTFLKGADV